MLVHMVCRNFHAGSPPQFLLEQGGGSKTRPSDIKKELIVIVWLDVDKM